MQNEMLYSENRIKGDRMVDLEEYHFLDALNYGLSYLCIRLDFDWDPFVTQGKRTSVTCGPTLIA